MEMTQPKFKVGDVVKDSQHYGTCSLTIIAVEYNGEIGEGLVEKDGEQYQYEVLDIAAKWFDSDTLFEKWLVKAEKAEEKK